MSYRKCRHIAWAKLFAHIACHGYIVCAVCVEKEKYQKNPALDPLWSACSKVCCTALTCFASMFCSHGATAGWFVPWHAVAQKQCHTIANKTSLYTARFCYIYIIETSYNWPCQYIGPHMHKYIEYYIWTHA